jgi:ADP-heptose:LPS heptosyltransferase
MKILVIRFSSIGDIVLTTPVLRCLKQQVANCEVHYATKESYKSLLLNNPYVDKIHLLKKSESDFIDELKLEKFDYIIDLHHNLRTLRIKWALNCKAISFNKNNVLKWLMVQFKKKELLEHVSLRYLKTIEKWAKYDGEGLDYFLSPKDELILQKVPTTFTDYWVYAIGGQFETKKMPLDKMKELLLKIKVPVILIGGPEDDENALELIKNHPNRLSFCGKSTLNESAALVKNAKGVITHDTGFMHIAAAFSKPIVSIWGSTVPSFGMTPFLPQNVKLQSYIHEVTNLSCRPCSKIGFAKCPQNHFNCMRLQNTDLIAKNVADISVNN